MVCYVGMRGVVSFSCASIFSNANGNHELILGLTTSIALVTLFIQGALTPLVISGLKIPVGVEFNKENVRSYDDLSNY